jgi:microcystin-dependent protein
MTFSSGSIITAADYNSFLGANNSSTTNTINTIWGFGNGSAGYGQAVLSNVTGGTSTITATQWASLINTLNSIKTHQTGSGTGLTARTLGASVGTETQTLTVANLPSHNHNIFGDSGSGIGSGTTTDRVLVNSDGDVRNVLVKTTELTGSGTAHNNIQPTIFLNFFVFSG